MLTLIGKRTKSMSKSIKQVVTTNEEKSIQVFLTMSEEMVRWERQEGVKFLRRIGLCANQTVLDFGCGVGHYSIPAAFAVGKTGKVYAVDKHQHSLEELKRKANHRGLENIETIKTSGQIGLTFVDSVVDVILLYDVLHYFDHSERGRLYSECLRILDNDGLLSVYPKHTIEDGASRKFQGTCVADIIYEIKKTGFHFLGKYCDVLSHDDSLNQGCVLNFIKKKRKI